MTSLEEKKKVWEALRAKKIAERMAKANAWRAEAEARRLGNRTQTLLALIEKPKEIEIIPVKKIPKKRVVKLKLEKFFPKKTREKPKLKGKTTAEKKPLLVPEKKTTKNIREEIRNPIKVWGEELRRKIEGISTAGAGSRAKKIKKGGRPRKKEFIRPIEKELNALLKEPLPEKKPKTEKNEGDKKPVETVTLVGQFTEISMPKTRSGKGLDWSAKRFKELEEKLKELRRF